MKEKLEKILIVVMSVLIVSNVVDIILNIIEFAGKQH